MGMVYVPHVRLTRPLARGGAPEAPVLPAMDSVGARKFQPAQRPGYRQEETHHHAADNPKQKPLGRGLSCPQTEVGWVVKSSQVKSSQVKSGQVKSSQVKSGQVRSGQVKSSQVKSSQVKSGQVK